MKCAYNATMSKGKKRTRITAKESSASSITIKVNQYKAANGTYYDNFMVQGWKENGKWQRKQFKDRKDAERYAATKRIELETSGRSQQMILTSLNEEQVKQAEAAFEKLGETYSLQDAVQFFLDNHRPPEFTISLSHGIEDYLQEQKQAGTRERTLKQKRSVLTMFKDHVEDIDVHACSTSRVNTFLKSLRAKDKISPATKKTWNNYRNDLNHFFLWAGEEDLTTSRPWLFQNPVEKVKIFSAKQIAEQRPQKATTSAQDTEHFFSVLMRWRSGALVKFYALAYFAGIRPDGEMRKLSELEDTLINLKTGIINIPASVSKTKEERQVFISDNLKEWLKKYDDMPIIPSNFDRMNKQLRKHFKLQHDETRHSFISYHVAVHRSVGDVALQAGNSESIVRKHYLNLHPAKEGEHFFSIICDTKKRRAVVSSKIKLDSQKHLKAI